MAADAPLKIMVVEDDAIIAADMSAMIEELGGDRVVCQAMNTAEALDCAANWKPDGAFVDVNLEDGGTGPRIGQQLAERFGTAVVYATGNPEQIPPENPGLAAAVKPVSHQCVKDALAVIHAHSEGRPLPELRAPCQLIMPLSTLKGR